MSNVHEAKHLFKLNKFYSAAEKRTNKAADIVINYCKNTKIKSSDVIVNVLEKGISHLSPAWLSTFSFDFLVPAHEVIADHRVLSITFTNHIKQLTATNPDTPCDVIASIKCKRTNIVSFNGNKTVFCDELRNWTINWVKLNSEVVWSYSYITFSIIGWCLDNAKIIQLDTSENKVSFVAEYRVSNSEYELIHVTIDHESAFNALKNEE